MGASWSNQDGGETKPKGKPKRAAAKKNRPKAKSDIFDNFTFENESQEEGEYPNKKVSIIFLLIFLPSKYSGVICSFSSILFSICSPS